MVQQTSRPTNPSGVMALKRTTVTHEKTANIVLVLWRVALCTFLSIQEAPVPDVSSVGPQRRFLPHPKTKRASTVQSATQSKSSRTRNVRSPDLCLQHSKWNLSPERKYLTVFINKMSISLQLDTASDITLISRSSRQLIGKPDVSFTTHRAQSASGPTLLLTGKLAYNVSFNNLHFSGTCYPTDCPNLTILGLDWIECIFIICVQYSGIFVLLRHCRTLY
ncbi:hypothetical protein CLF_103738 [Clonorchis sinensis]|uniref:Peptidase A2 domain-containing protein n=1 Tax=Clonorchis sinensis TaxID=79923 RepID=G7YAA1_CLOSI|nr:hypothetical protein CLF_103738 [Clonorchis sinensis]